MTRKTSFLLFTVIAFFVLAAFLNCGSSSSSNDGNVLTIGYMNVAQYLFESPSGVRVFTDVGNSGAVARLIGDRVLNADDILLVTHTYHREHYNNVFADAFPGRIVRTAETVEGTDISVAGFAALHGEPGELFFGNVTSYLIEAAGIRVAFLGSFGQARLTEEQLQTIGRADVLIMQMGGGSPEMTFDRYSGIVESLNPKLVMVTHFNEEGMAQAVERWPTFYTGTPVRLRADRLPETTTLLIMGNDEGPAIDTNHLRNGYDLQAWEG